MNSRRLVLAAIALALFGSALTADWLWVLHDHRLQFTTREVHLQTAALAEHAGVVLNAVEATLRGAARDAAEAHGLPADAEAGLRRRVSANPSLVSLAFVAADGRVLATSASPARPPTALGTAIRLTHAVAEGGPVARVVAEVDSRFVDEFFGRITASHDARAGLFGLDGQHLGGTLAWAEVRDGGSSALLVAAQPLDHQPMIAATARERSVVLAQWHVYVASAVFAGAIALALLTLTVRRLQREMRARVQAQTALQRTQRLEAIGRLAGGIAHDFNNILALILGYGELLQRHAAPASAAAGHAAQVLRAAERGRRLVARILSFRSGQARSAATIEVDAVIAEALALQRSAAPPGIAFEVALNAPGATVRGDAAMLFEAIDNLCANALQAVGERGLIRIETSVASTSAARALSHGTLAAGRHVHIVVADDGHGMSPAALDQLFEPFFTTRQAHGGTGLGLAMVHGAVQEMGGAIDVQSARGRGARFALALPCHAEAAAGAIAARGAAPAEAPAAALPRGRGEVVMIVDDEPALVALIEDQLAELGYEPAGFRSSAAALQALRETPQRYDALLTDQSMPGLDGLDLARAWRALRPEAPVLLVSGHGGAELRVRARGAGVSVLLDKPLQHDMLAQALADALAAVPAAIR